MPELHTLLSLSRRRFSRNRVSGCLPAKVKSTVVNEKRKERSKCPGRDRPFVVLLKTYQTSNDRDYEQIKETDAGKHLLV
jgi:hypothetical protein